VGSVACPRSLRNRNLTATVAIGTLDLTTRRFIATEVLAGSSVLSHQRRLDRERDCPHRKHPDCERCGVVPKRRNVEFPEHGDGDRREHDEVVSQKVSSGPQIAIAPDISSISVGQRVTVFGILNAAGTTMDATTPPVASCACSSRSSTAPSTARAPESSQ